MCKIVKSPSPHAFAVPIALAVTLAFLPSLVFAQLGARSGYYPDELGYFSGSSGISNRMLAFIILAIYFFIFLKSLGSYLDRTPKISTLFAFFLMGGAIIGAFILAILISTEFPRAVIFMGLVLPIALLFLLYKTGNKNKSDKVNSAQLQVKSAPNPGEGKNKNSGLDSSLQRPAAANPQVAIKTSMGEIVVELYPDKAPKSVANFLEYVNSKHYDGTIFHRVIGNFMIQGGGFSADFYKAGTPNFGQKPTRAPIVLESRNGLRNDTGWIAMARTANPDSATAQFFINTVDNDGLNHPQPDGHGYAVFGKVVKGMEVVNKIRAVPTSSIGPHHDVPNDPVIIEFIISVVAGASQNNDQTRKSNAETSFFPAPPPKEASRQDCNANNDITTITKRIDDEVEGFFRRDPGLWFKCYQKTKILKQRDILYKHIRLKYLRRKLRQSKIKVGSDLSNKFIDQLPFMPALEIDKALEESATDADQLSPKIRKKKSKTSVK